MADSYDMMSQSQQMTQPQTQYSQTLQHSPPPAFPSNLWGMLVASYPTADSSSSIPASTSRSGHNGHHTDQSVDIAGKPARVELSWDKLAIRVGRHPRADIVLNGAKISSWHARIYYDEDQKCVKLEDSSSNGTYVRGQKVSPSWSTLPGAPTGSCVPSRCSSTLTRQDRSGSWPTPGRTKAQLSCHHPRFSSAASFTVQDAHAYSSS